MIHMQSIKMDLPTAVMGQKDFKPEIINIDIDKTGQPYIEKEPKTLAEVYNYLTNRLATKTNLPVYIRGDREATHGSVISVLDLVRKAGVMKVSFAINLQEKK